MIAPEELYQAITFFAAVATFDIMERRNPGFTVNRASQLPLNLLAMLTVIVAGEACKKVIMSGFDALRFGRIFSFAAIRALPLALKMLATIILTDLLLYWIHRAMHRRLLWRTHAFHHTIGQIWWLAGSRTSITHLFLFAAPQVFLGYYLMGFSAREAAILFSFGVVVNLWIHTNLWVNLGPMENIIITPQYHRIHHGARGLSNKNLGFVFTVWDRMFGTYTSTGVTGRDFPLMPVPTKGKLSRMFIGM